MVSERSVPVRGLLTVLGLSGGIHARPLPNKRVSLKNKVMVRGGLILKVIVFVLGGGGWGLCQGGGQEE